MKTQMALMTAMLVLTLVPAGAEQAPTPTAAPRARTTTPPPPPAPPVAGGTAAARRSGQPVNVQIEFTITDQRDGVPAVKRTVSVIVGDTYTGQIRSQSDLMNTPGQMAPITPLTLNIDATPELLADGKIRAGFNLQYDWAPPQSEAAAPARGAVLKTSLRDTVSLILESGKPMIAAQSADPAGDRKVTVEVKATILR
jgi:hypothetical protein